MQNFINNIEQTLISNNVMPAAAKEIATEVLASGFRGTPVLAFDLWDYISDHVGEDVADRLTHKCIVNLMGERMPQA